MCTRFGHIYLLETGLGELDWLNTTDSAEASCSLVDSTESYGAKGRRFDSRCWWVLFLLVFTRWVIKLWLLVRQYLWYIGINRRSPFLDWVATKRVGDLAQGYEICKFNTSIIATSINMGLMLTKMGVNLCQHQPHIDRGFEMFCLHLRNSSPSPGDRVLK